MAFDKEELLKNINKFGTTISEEANSIINNVSNQVFEYVKKDTETSENNEKQEFNNICPNCNYRLGEFESYCPACGTYIKEIKKASAVQKLLNDLQKIESRRSGIFTTFTDKYLNKDAEVYSTDREKAERILNADIPSDKEEILAFATLAASRIDVSVYDMEPDLTKNIKQIDISSKQIIVDAWKNQLFRVHAQAKAMYGDTTFFDAIDDIYNEVIAKYEERDRRIKEEEERLRQQVEQQKKIAHKMEQKQEQKKKVMFVGMLTSYGVIICLCLGLYIWSSHLLDSNYINVGFDSGEYVGSNYKDVEKIIRAKGFENITFSRKEDLIIGFIKKDGEVEGISFDGVSEYSDNKRFPKDSLVVIEYHTFPE